MARKSTNRKPVPKDPVQGTSIKKSTHDPVENEWQQFYVLAEHWASDLKFFNDEVQFLSILVDRYFMGLTDEKNVDTTKSVASKLSDVEKRRLALEEDVSAHLHHLANLVENPFPHNAQDYRDEHGALEKTLADFVKYFKAIKKEIFSLTEQVIESEKAKHLLTR